MKLAELKAHMEKTIEATQRSLNTIRTGRANVSLLDRVMVEYYGAETPLKSLATLSTPDATTIAIQPFDLGSMALIEKAILTSDVGLTPYNDGKMIRLSIPPLTTERRQEFVKTAGKLTEEGKVALRNIRRDAVESVRKEEKNGDLSKDESRDQQAEIQKITDGFSAKLDAQLAAKEKEITTV